MNARKKTWTNSMFSELSQMGKACSTKSKFTREDSPTKTKKRTIRKRCASVEQKESIINLDAEAKASNTTPKNSEVLTQDVGLEGESNAMVHKENWIDGFAPINSEDLAVHPKKQQEIQQWFLHCRAVKRKQPAQICLITGPSGSGKTMAIRILAKENQISIQEWINPVDQEVVYNLGDHIYGQSYISSQLESFKNFLFKASRYRSLFEPAVADGNRLLLVEDFPNFLLRDAYALEEILEDYINYAKSPLVFIVTDAKSCGLNISYNLFTDQLKQKFLINHVTFNAVATTIMQKAMKRFCSLMCSQPYNDIYKPPSADIIDSIIVSAQGDVRNALINLHFSSLKGAPNLLTKRLEIVEESKTSKRRKQQSKLKSVGRNESVSMMHALGRVFNPKFNDDKSFLHSPEELAEILLSEPRRFVDLVQANYIQHFRNIDDVLVASNGLSLCDVMLNEYRDDSLALTGLNIGIRSVMVANVNPVSGWMPDIHNISSNLYAVDYKTFVKIISPPSC